MDTETLMELTADIVTAHLGHNRVTANDLPGLIQSVYGALAGVGQPARVVEQRPQPAVSVRASVKPDVITCLECGAKMTMLKRHLASDHDLSPAAYRARWQLSSDYPMTAPDHSATRREIARKIGLGRSRDTKGASSTPARKSPRPATAAVDAEG
jgi:predicted transcriptional regulator